MRPRTSNRRWIDIVACKSTINLRLCHLTSPPRHSTNNISQTNNYISSHKQEQTSKPTQNPSSNNNVSPPQPLNRYPRRLHNRLLLQRAPTTAQCPPQMDPPLRRRHSPLQSPRRRLLNGPQQPADLRHPSRRQERAVLRVGLRLQDDRKTCPAPPNKTWRIQTHKDTFRTSHN